TRDAVIVQGTYGVMWSMPSRFGRTSSLPRRFSVLPFSSNDTISHDDQTAKGHSDIPAIDDPAGGLLAATPDAAARSRKVLIIDLLEEEQDSDERQEWKTRCHFPDAALLRCSTR